MVGASPLIACVKNAGTTRPSYGRILAVGIEDPDNSGFDPMKPVVGHGHCFCKALRFVVHSPRSRRVYMTPIGFWLGMYFRVPIHFGRRGEKQSGTFRLREPEQVVGSEDPTFSVWIGYVR